MEANRQQLVPGDMLHHPRPSDREIYLKPPSGAGLTRNQLAAKEGGVGHE